MNGAHVPLRLRVIWWLMVRLERGAQWCRLKWVHWHDNRGVVLPVVSGACKMEMHRGCGGCACSCHGDAK